MRNREFFELSESSQLILGAYAIADLHTLSIEQVSAMSHAALSAEKLETAMQELIDRGYTELVTEPVLEADYRLTRAGIELTLKLQEALAPDAPLSQG